MSDVEKARELLTDVVGLLRANADFIMPAIADDVRSRIDDAIRALDGEAGEEMWEAKQYAPPGQGGWWSVWATLNGHSRLVVDHLDDPDAHRIARLPALERAAQDAVNAFPPGSITMEHDVFDKVSGIVNSLRAALNDKP